MRHPSVLKQNPFSVRRGDVTTATGLRRDSQPLQPWRYFKLLKQLSAVDGECAKVNKRYLNAF